MAFVPKGSKWPRNAEEYPRHPDWLTIAQAAALLGVSKQAIQRQIYINKTLTPVLKKWRHGCHSRSAVFLSRYEVEQLGVRIAVKKKKIPTKGKPNMGAAPSVVAVNPLRQWRKEQGKTAAEVAQELHVTDILIAGWEHGRSDPNEPTMANLANLMECNLEDLKMRWAAWRILMLDPLPKAGRVAIKLDFNRSSPDGISPQEPPDEAA